MNYELKRPLSTLFAAGDHIQKYTHIKSELILGDLIRKPPLYTVLIPTYKRPKQLVEAVQSAIVQTIDPSMYEILIIDNEYEYDSISVEKVRALNANNLLYYQNRQNLGGLGNWNRGFELSRTEWVCMLHDDDILYPHALESIDSTIRALDKAMTVAILPNFDFAHQINGKWVCKKSPPIHPWRNLLQNRLARRSLLKLQLGIHNSPVAPTCGATLNRHAVLEMGGFPDQYKSDDLFFLFSLSTKYYCYSTQKILGQYRWGNNDSLKESTKAALLMENMIMNDFFLMFPQKGILTMIDRWFRKRLKYLICIYPIISQNDSKQRDYFVEKYCPEWKDYKSTRVEKVLFRTRRLIVLAYEMTATILSKKDNSYVKNR